MIAEEFKGCVSLNRNSKVTVKENGKQAIFLNPERIIYCVIHVDGCVIQQKIASDYVISKAEVGDVVIELKGCDVDHAVDQVFATAEFWTRNKFRVGKIAGLIICSRKPSFDTKIQRVQALFAKKFEAPMHVIARSDEFVFERVLSFSGPK
jgi:hypothetical protein